MDIIYPEPNSMVREGGICQLADHEVIPISFKLQRLIGKIGFPIKIKYSLSEEAEMD